MPTYRVRNLEKYQHYKDRNPPWVKVYNLILDDYEFCALPDPTKWLLVGFLLLASKTDNQIPDDPSWIKSKLAMTTKPDVQALLSMGFIECSQDASKPLAERLQDACSETERETEESRERTDTVASSATKSDSPNGEMTGSEFKASWGRAFEKFYGDYPRKGHRQAALSKWMARVPAFNAAAKDKPKDVLRARYVEISRRLNEIVDERAGDLDSGNLQFIPYADAFLNKEF